MKKRIILDTNFLMIPPQYKIDIFQEIKKIMNEPYEMCVFKETITELKKIASGKGKDSSNAKVALLLIKQKNLKSLKNSHNLGYVDDIILNNITDEDIVCTQDKALKKRLKEKYPNIQIITLNKKLIMR
ncbi:MAG: nucleotide-binding protein [Candidatus Woesearchaeota archaeon]